MMLAITRRAWFNLVNPVPFVAPILMSKGKQRLLRHMLLGFMTTKDALSAEDVELFVGRFREPARARAGSALYRRFIQPEAARILSGSYRGARLTTPTRVLVGADDPNIRREFLHGYEEYVDDLALEFVDGASHFVADERPGVVTERALELFARTRLENG